MFELILPMCVTFIIGLRIVTFLMCFSMRLGAE